MIVLAGGSGARFGAEKQYVLLADRPVVAWSVDRARSAAAADLATSGTTSGGGVVLVVPTHRLGEGFVGADVVVAGGSSRSASVRAGLAQVPDTAEVIVVHDAARPLASSALFASVIGAVLAGADAAVPGVAVTDTIRRRGGGIVDRSDLLRVQTPQGFRAGALREAHRHLAEATDDATLVELAGGTVAVVPGEITNIKLTDPTDLAVANVLLRLMMGSEPAAGAAPQGTTGGSSSEGPDRRGVPGAMGPGSIR